MRGAGRSGDTSAVTNRPRKWYNGAEQEPARIRVRLLGADVRLLALVGPAGVGKTRLALQLGTDLHEVFRDGAAFVALAALRDPALVAEAIAQTLGVRGTASRSL